MWPYNEEENKFISVKPSKTKWYRKFYDSFCLIQEKRAKNFIKNRMYM